jgi:hypothetical protein
MIHGLSNKEFVLSVLRDGNPHFSREFVRSADGEDLLLDYRKRISELRSEGFDIRPIKINGRPAYKLYSLPGDLFS